MRVGALEETITVRSESPVVDVLRVESRNVISKDALETLPTNKTLPAFVALTPGLVAAATSQDVGGSKGEVFIQPAIHGGRTTESRTVLDGFETNSPDVGGSGRVFVPNPASTQAISVELGDGPGDSPSSGVAINFVPRDGGNRFTGTMIGNYSHDNLQGTNISSELESRGLNASSIGGLDRIWDTSIGVGGPINRDRVWFFTSYRYWGSANRVPNQFYNATPTGPVLHEGRGASGARRLHEPPLQRPRHLAGVAAQQVQYLVGQPVPLRLSPQRQLDAGAGSDGRADLPARHRHRHLVVPEDQPAAVRGRQRDVAPRLLADAAGLCRAGRHLHQRAVEQPDLSGRSVERRLKAPASARSTASRRTPASRPPTSPDRTISRPG